MQQLPFPIEEYEKRQAGLKKLMAESGMDAVLVLSGVNISYFAGYPAPALSQPRPYFLLLPAEGEPVFIVHAARRLEAHAYSSIEDVRTYATLVSLPPELPAILADVTPPRATIGCELGGEMCLNLPSAQFAALEEALPDVRFADASDAIWQLRMIKSPAEIAFHKEACRILGEAYLATFGSLKPGITQNEVARRHKINMIERGGDSPFMVITSGAGTYDFATGMPSERKVETGDVLWMDGACSVGGCFCDFSRAAVIGKPSPDQKAMHREIIRITEACVDMIKPGVPCAELDRFSNAELAKLAGSFTSSISGLAGRTGHGVGFNVTEPPHIGEHEERLLQPGMIITIEPGVGTEYGTFHFEANIVVTPDGHEVTSTVSSELFEV